MNTQRVESDTGLGPTQKRILSMTLDEELRPRRIAELLNISTTRVYAVLRQLKQKGFLDSNRPIHTRSQNTTPVSQKRTGVWAYHALHFVVRPYYFYPRYERMRLELGGYAVRFRDWSFKFHKDLVEVQLREFVRFEHSDKWKSTRLAQESFESVLKLAGSRYGFEVWKEGKANIKLVNDHLARNPSQCGELAESHVQVRASDGRVFFVLDKSKGEEREYVRASRAVGDSERLEPYLQDMLEEEPPNLSELDVWRNEMASLMDALVTENAKTATLLRGLLASQRPVKANGRLPKEEVTYIG